MFPWLCETRDGGSGRETGVAAVKTSPWVVLHVTVSKGTETVPQEVGRLVRLDGHVETPMEPTERVHGWGSRVEGEDVVLTSGVRHPSQ